MIAIDEALLVPFNFHNVSYHCYYGVIEGYEKTLNWGEGLARDPAYLGVNLYLNFGIMYQSIRNMAVFFGNYNYLGSKDIYDAGFQFGSFIYYFLYPQSIYQTNLVSSL